MITCLIVEDEPLAAEILQDYVRQIPFLHLSSICSDAIYAADIMQREKVDLLLLDIHLPGLKGLDFLKSLPSPPKVILTTAYHEYALQGYELNVVDYLLKPIEFSRFLLAINKVRITEIHSSLNDNVIIQSENKKVVIAIHEIIYIESQKEYIKIQTLASTYTTKYAISKMEEELNKELFIRVHRSFIVAIKKIKAFNGHEVELPGKTIPIGGNYKELVAMRLKNLFG
jgi:DNA-binding LytR/AlgR family response regulator